MKTYTIKLHEVGKKFKAIFIQKGYDTNSPIVFEYNPFEDLDVVSVYFAADKIIEDSDTLFFHLDTIDIRANCYYRHYDQNRPIPHDENMKKLKPLKLNYQQFIMSSRYRW